DREAATRRVLRGVLLRPDQDRRRSPPESYAMSLLSGERHEVVFTELEYEEDRGVGASVRNEMGTTRPHGIRLTGHQADVLLGITQEDAQAPLEDEERVRHARVVVPRHALARADLELGDAKPRSLGVVS